MAIIIGLCVVLVVGTSVGAVAFWTLFVDPVELAKQRKIARVRARYAQAHQEVTRANIAFRRAAVQAVERARQSR